MKRGPSHKLDKGLLVSFQDNFQDNFIQQLPPCLLALVTKSWSAFISSRRLAGSLFQVLGWSWASDSERFLALSHFRSPRLYESLEQAISRDNYSAIFSTKQNVQFLYPSMKIILVTIINFRDLQDIVAI